MNNMNYYETILKRESCRDFTSETPDTFLLHEVQNYFTNAERLFPDIKLECKFYNEGISEKIGHNAGYNGFFIHAPKYLMLFSEQKEHYLENAAFVAQDLTLKITELELDTCWITIDDPAAIKNSLEPDLDMTPVVLIALGYKNKEKKSVRLDIKSPSNVKMTSRKNLAAPKISLDELVSYEHLGNPVPDGMLYEELEEALLSVSFAQSFMNRQPYRILLSGNSVTLLGIKDELTGELDTRLNFGIVMFNFISVMHSMISHRLSWSFEKPKDLPALPGEYFFVAQCNL